MVSKQGGRSIQWMDRLTAFAILWGRACAESAQPKRCRSRRNLSQQALPATENPFKMTFPQRSLCAAQMVSNLGSRPDPIQFKRGGNRKLFSDAPFEFPLRMGARKGVPGKPSTGWFASTVCSPFPEERFAFLFYGASPAPRDFLKKIE